MPVSVPRLCLTSTAIPPCLRVSVLRRTSAAAGPLQAEEGQVFLGEMVAAEKVGTALQGAQQALPAAPSVHLLMVAGEQHLRHGPAAEVGRARVLRVLETL